MPRGSLRRRNGFGSLEGLIELGNPDIRECFLGWAGSEILPRRNEKNKGNAVRI